MTIKESKIQNYYWYIHNHIKTGIKNNHPKWSNKQCGFWTAKVMRNI